MSATEQFSALEPSEIQAAKGWKVIRHKKKSTNEKAVCASLTNSTSSSNGKSDPVSENAEIPPNPIGPCHRCKKMGHLRKSCKVIGPCRICQEMGHFKKDCPTIGPCHGCHAFGHRVAWCPKRYYQGKPVSSGPQSLMAFAKPARG